ncbi:MAG TPA: hypothetical protein DHL02_19320 [Achromobacter sp.]|nr:hypothetical protein [Achromobacter sp.]
MVSDHHRSHDPGHRHAVRARIQGQRHQRLNDHPPPGGTAAPARPLKAPYGAFFFAPTLRASRLLPPEGAFSPWGGPAGKDPHAARCALAAPRGGFSPLGRPGGEKTILAKVVEAGGGYRRAPSPAVQNLFGTFRTMSDPRA